MKYFVTFLKNWKKAHSFRQALRRHDPFWRWIVAVLVVLLLLVICSPTLTQLYDPVDLKAGERSPMTVVAPFSFKAKDPVAWEQAKDRASDSVPFLFNFLEDVEPRVLSDIDRTAEVISTVAVEDRITTEARAQEILNRLQSELEISLPFSELQQALQYLPNRLFPERLKQIAGQMYNRHGVVTREDFEILYNVDTPTRIQVQPEKPGLPFNRRNVIVEGEGVRNFVSRELAQFYPPASEDEIDRALYTLGRHLLFALAEPNIVYNAEGTRLLQDQAERSVDPPFRLVEAGEIIVEKGQFIGKREEAAITQYNATIRFSRLKVMGSHLIIILAIIAFLATYIRKFYPGFELNTSNILSVAFPVILTLFIARLTVHYMGDDGGYFFFAGTIGILIVIMIDARLALMVVIAAALLFGLTTNLNNLTFVILPIFGGFTAILSLYNVRKRQDILFAGIWIAIVNMIVIAVMEFISRPGELPSNWAILFGGLNGLLSSFISYPLLVVCEYFFGITTDLKLLELTGLNHPALLDLEDRAPGSYQHSLNVTKLAEAAADDIGANTLLVRAGGYFHDIGKMLKPKYFSENQVTPEERNIHKGLSPFMSCLIIKNHVKEGIELARNKYHLPERVIEFIPQHQGTSLIRYFYHQAIKNYEESSAAEPVSEDEFRYPGPNPQSIEAAVLLLADTVEATATSKLTGSMVREDEIRRLVRTSIQDKFAEGQFDECPLTLRDLYTIGESFVKSLRARFHHRVAYPEKSAPSATATAKVKAV